MVEINRFLIGFSVVLVLALCLHACNDEVPELFSEAHEVALADQLHAWVASDSILTLLDETTYATSYNYANGVLSSLIGDDSTAIVDHYEEYEWEVGLLRSADYDAYVLPAGKIYLNTGLIKLLQNEASFTSLLAHLVVHSDKRHVTKILLTQFSSTNLVQASNGANNQSLEEIGAFLFGRDEKLEFSVAQEREADTTGVSYLAQSGYSCEGMVTFHSRLLEKQQEGSGVSFYDAHTLDNRIALISEFIEVRSDCNDDGAGFGGGFTSFKNSLP